MTAPKLTFQRRTMLTDAKRSAIVNKMALFFEDLAAEYGLDKGAMDIALFQQASVASLVVSSDIDGFLPLPTDDIDTVQAKARRWLTDINPEWVDVWEREIKQLNQTWADPATSPIPPETDDPN